MADATGVYDIAEWQQHGLSVGSATLPFGAAMWRRAIVVPFNLQNPLAPAPAACQIWPRYAVEDEE
jgi:hypothetical protein